MFLQLSAEKSTPGSPAVRNYSVLEHTHLSWVSRVFQDEMVDQTETKGLPREVTDVPTFPVLEIELDGALSKLI